MANTLLTSSIITREALRILHQKLNFIGSMNRAYDDSFAKDGAKIGDTLRIRLPNRYVVRTGATLVAQDTIEQQTTLQVNNQKGVDLNFTSVDLTLSLDDFSKRILQPAMSVLAANVEADAFNMLLNVYNVVNNIGTAATMRALLTGRKVLTDNLTPGDDRTAIFNTQDNLDLVDQLKGLFQDSTTIAQQYKTGMVGRTAGFGDMYENTLVPTSATGTAAAVTTYTVNGASQTGASITIQTGSTTFAVGDIVTFAGVNRVHPETRLDTGALQTFVVTAAYAGGGGNLQISPSIVVTGALQNVTASPANSAAVSKIGGASAIYRPSILFHKDAFTFATADLIMPKGVDMAAREVMDGLSMRMVRAYDIVNDKFPTRLDILYGYKCIRPELAVRMLSN